MKEITQYRVTLQAERTLQIAEPVCSSQDASERIARAYFAERMPHEELIAIALNGRNRVVGLVCVARGGAHGCAVLPLDVLRPLVAMGASAFVLAHNHPSGDPSPSREDVAMTIATRDAAEILGLTLLDHIVVGEHACSSVFALLAIDAHRAA